MMKTVEASNYEEREIVKFTRFTTLSRLKTAKKRRKKQNIKDFRF